jgi:hypothetical protein
MEAVRTIVNANVLTPIIDLPWKSKDVQVEVIVMPINEITNHRTDFGKSLKGCLKKYANPVLVEKESTAWENYIAEKYAIT